MSRKIKLVAGEAEAPRNQWYVIAFGNEVTSEPLARSIMGEPVVLYRQEDGTPVALFDRCPHRGMRLSNGGKVIDDTLQCGYHGLQFGADGSCVEVPSGGAITKMMCVKSYPLKEVWDFLWIWPGDPSKADPSLIPDHHELGVTDPSLYSYSGLFLEMKCNYLHAYENLVDATHISYLHHGFIDTGNVAAHPFVKEVTDNQVSTIRNFTDEPVFPYAKMSYGLNCDVVDRQLKLIAMVPYLTIVSETYQEKNIENPRKLLARLVVPVTPATDKTCYQFVTAVRTLPTEPEALFEGLLSFLEEDQVALADIQKLFDALPSELRVEAHVKSDNPALHVRRMIEKLITVENEDLNEDFMEVEE